MYTTFGYTSQSMSMFISNALTSGTTVVQIAQKVYFDNYYKPKKRLLLEETV